MHLFRIPFLLTTALLFGLILAQEPAPTEPTSSTSLSVAAVENHLAELEADTELEKSAKDEIKPKLAEAIEAIKKAAANGAKANGYRDTIQSAPAEVVELERQRAELPTSEEAKAVNSPESVDDLRKEIAKLQSLAADYEARQAATASELAAIKARPVENAARLPLAKAELADVESKLAGLPKAESDPAKNADLLLLKGQRDALVSEADLLMQERLSQSARESLLTARRDLLARQLENTRAMLSVQERAIKDALKSDAEQAAAEIEALAATEGGKGNKDFDQLVSELRVLATELQDSAGKIRETGEAHSSVKTKATDLKQEFDRIQSQIELGGLEGSFAQVLVELRRRLPNPRAIDNSLAARAELLRDVRLASFRIEDMLREQGKIEKLRKGKDTGAMLDLVRLRREVLEKLNANYKSLVNELLILDATERSYQKQITEVWTFLNKETFWKQSSPRVSGETLRNIPSALAWLFGPERWLEVIGAIRGIVHRHPASSTFLGLIVFLLLLSRRRIIALIEASGQQIHRISQDRYLYTFQALGGTILLTLPIPLVLGYLGWEIRLDGESSDWIRGLAAGMIWSSIAVAGALFLRECCRPKGLGIKHFGWDEEAADKLRRALVLLFVIYSPALLIVSSTLFEESSQHFDSAGRFVFSLAHFWIAYVLWKTMSASDGIIANVVREHPTRLVIRSRNLWIPLLVIIPMALVILSSFGYVLTAFSLSLTFLSSLGLVAAGVLSYSLILRWFIIKERRLALSEALAERQARKDAAEQGEEQADEVVSAEEEVERDLASVGNQTRRLFRSLTSVGTVVMVWVLWSRTLPLDEALSHASIGNLTLLGVAQSILVVAAFTTLVRNLPGLLELGGLRAAAKDAGTRHAITTICQYVVIAIGIALFSHVLNLDWSKLGWMAAALSVGLGFGLQEVVANFVCGIILLFERPIRVGDIVTISNVNGTVTRIQMRATTITNWDRDEFVVPNKLLITGTLINCTLSSTINRIVLSVGVAYGADTRKARQIMTEAAADHPGVMEDPAPLATLDQFADNSLTITLRCYLPDRDSRLSITSALHTTIEERFEQAGIEIALPQQELHLRSVDPQAGEVLRAEGRPADKKEPASNAHS